MFLNGQKVDFKGPKDAQAAGIAAVYQHPTSYPHLTVAENIFMGHEIIKNRMIQWKAMNTEANKLLKQLDADFDATAEMGTLSVAQQQMVEIAKAMSTNARIIILDEPTAALTRSESEKLYTLVDKLKADGVSIIFISHRFEDMYRLDVYKRQLPHKVRSGHWCPVPVGSYKRQPCRIVCCKRNLPS